MSTLIKFLKNLFSPSAGREGAITLYSHAVAQARRAEFYTGLAVPDTLDGRFDMVVLHVYLLLDRLNASEDLCTDVQMVLQEALFADLDRTLREIGVGDLAVGRHVKEMAAAYFGRLKAYDAALESHDDAPLIEALGRNVWRGTPPEGDAPARLAHYIRKQSAHLEGLSDEDLCAGTIAFLDPIKEIVTS
ncbi:ubiquinol-cytochrome c chaperone [Iodidimonas gelatinilytica]|uniref:Ubiquinol-cytochrome c chaperone n=1 Tax=Iodidimonas gelatinilytica TaxID=1236966 RepID=A0A5A7MXA0_9PROT|nr:ubiquinol-cytochrome C chaperone family protein [Iodidimonas gelatinilytica]GER00711.1 ubiquinol-cytochrome c chaperone [Iodidimonas gelatinilytica]